MQVMRGWRYRNDLTQNWIELPSWYVYVGRLANNQEMAYVDREGHVSQYDGDYERFYFDTEEEAELAAAKALRQEQPELIP